MKNQAQIQIYSDFTARCFNHGLVDDYNPRQCPALVVEFEYWPAEHCESGKAEMYGMDHYKPGRWREFMRIVAED